MRYSDRFGQRFIYEGGTSRGTFGSYTTGDVLRVAVEGGVVKYRKNGALLYTSTVTPVYPLLVDSALHGTGDMLSNVVISGANGGSGGTPLSIHWLVTDHLGTPRMVFDQTGSLAKVKRHDYLPFGEELFAEVGGRTPENGYAGGDGVRQQFTLKERDSETGLDYFFARYYSSLQGRFTGVDPDNYQAQLDLTDPQSWNAYSYVNNNPLVRVDPDGKGFFSKLKNWLVYDVWGEEEDVKREEDKRRNILLEKQKENGGVLIIENLGGDLIQVDPARMTRLQIFFWTNRLMDIHEQGGGFRPLRPDEMVHLGNSMTGRYGPIHQDRSNHMVSSKIINEIKDLYRQLRAQSLDIHEYSGRMFHVVFEIITADTYVAGVASKIMDGDTVTPEEQSFIARPMLMEGRWWRCDDGQLFDIELYKKVKLAASIVESLRHKCNDALISTIP